MHLSKNELILSRRFTYESSFVTSPLPKVLEDLPPKALGRIEKCFLECRGRAEHVHMEFMSSRVELSQIRVHVKEGRVSYLLILRKLGDGWRKHVFHAMKCDYFTELQCWKTTRAVYAISKGSSSAEYGCVRNLQMHKMLSERIPNSVSLYPYVESAPGVYPIAYFQKYYSKAWRAYQEASLYCQLEVAQAVTKAFSALHAIHCVHNDVTKDNIFIEEKPGPLEKLSYKARLNDFDLAEDLRLPLKERVSFGALGRLTEKQREVVSLLLKTPILDTLSVLYETFRLASFFWAESSKLSPIDVLTSSRGQVRGLFCKTLAFIVDGVKQHLLNDLRAASLRMSIGRLFQQAVFAAKDLQEKAESDPGFLQELAATERSEEQVEALLGKIHEDFPRMEEIHQFMKQLITASYVKNRDKWLQHVESEMEG